LARASFRSLIGFDPLVNSHFWVTDQSFFGLNCEYLQQELLLPTHSLLSGLSLDFHQLVNDHAGCTTPLERISRKSREYEFMRLTSKEQKMILHIANRFFGSKTQVILFGSRVNDHIRGGDIDLLILPNKPLDNTYEKKLAFSAALKNEIGDQKIDVILASRADPRPVVQQALTTGVRL